VRRMGNKMMVMKLRMSRCVWTVGVILGLASGGHCLPGYFNRLRPRLRNPSDEMQTDCHLYTQSSKPSGFPRRRCSLSSRNLMCLRRICTIPDSFYGTPKPYAPIFHVRIAKGHFIDTPISRTLADVLMQTQPFGCLVTIIDATGASTQNLGGTHLHSKAGTLEFSKCFPLTSPLSFRYR
jgi:hypothetical protein